MGHNKYKILPVFLILVLVFFILLSGSCTIKKISEVDKGKKNDEYSTWTKSGKAFDPVEYVDSIWEEKLLPLFLSSSFPFQEVFAALQSDSEEATKKYGLKRKSGEHVAAFKVKGTGVVLQYDDSSRNGLLAVDLLPADGTADVTLQVGPVIRKTAIRDSMDFISFTDVGNQLQFASLADELNARMKKDAVEPLDLENIAGKTIEFYGAFKIEDDQGIDAIVVTPVKIDVTEGQGE
jgi:predicted lipoprotein